jgi:hypothetical protein
MFLFLVSERRSLTQPAPLARIFYKFGFGAIIQSEWFFRPLKAMPFKPESLFFRRLLDRVCFGPCMSCAYRFDWQVAAIVSIRQLVGHTDDRDHLFRSIATSVARVLTAPLDDGGDVSLLMAGQAR